MKVIMLHFLHWRLRAEEIAGVVQVGLRRFLGEKPCAGSSGRLTATRQSRHGDRRVQRLLCRVELLPICPLVGRVDDADFGPETI